jgi:DNA-binding CsgD family transcriptional regulator
MLPLHIAGLALGARALLTKYNIHPLPNKRQFILKPRPISIKKFQFPKRSISENNPIQLLFKGLSSALARGTKKSTVLDYDSVIRSFLPANAEILTPKFPLNSRRYLVTDLDGDSYEEIVASYKQGDEVTSIVLKQRSGVWHKVSEINHPGYLSLHYRGTAALSDEGKVQLLIGLAGHSSDNTLYCYSIQEDNIQTLFNRNYQRLELVNQQRHKDDSLDQQLAIWKRNDDETYDIDVLQLRNNRAENIENIEPYYSTKVVPYYIRRIKQSPYSTANWYNLAEALIKQKAYKDAQIAIEIGNELDKKSEFKERFNSLKGKIN